MAFNSPSVIIWFITIRQPKHDSNAVFYFRDPTNVGCFLCAFSLPPSVGSAYINIISTNGKQDALKQPEANTDLIYFSGLSYHKSSVETSFLYSLLSHPRIRIIVLTCPDNINVIVQVCKKSSAEIIRAVSAKSQNHNASVARPILFPLKSLLPFSLFLFV